MPWRPVWRLKPERAMLPRRQVFVRRIKMDDAVKAKVENLTRSPSLLPSPPQKRRAGERRPFFTLSPALSPLVPRGERGKNALVVCHAEHDCRDARATVIFRGHAC